MNIYDKFPITFIHWAVTHGMHPILNENYIDLDTGMKSHCHLYYEDGKYIAKMRYDNTAIITIFDDLRMAIRDCECGKGYMSSYIIELYNDGFGWELENEPFC